MRACGESRLPVYRVVQTGISEGQARKLEEAFRIPAGRLHWRDGHASFVDRHKYLAVPSVAVDQPETVERFTTATTNHHPEIPIALHGIDYAALERHQPLAPEAALKAAADALDRAGLTPASARPMVGHTRFTTVSVGDDSEEKERRTTPLDTHVSYRFTLDGFPLIGPGAQVQVSFASGGEVTRVLHSTRALEPGPSVAILDEEAIRQRLACSLPDEAEVTLELVYYSPGLRSELNASSYWRPTELLPYYAVRVTRQLVHPGRGTAHPLTSRIPSLTRDRRRAVRTVGVA